MGSISSKNHALVFGSSGIQGWATVKALLEDYPTPTTFERVTALTNRPLPLDVAQWPSSEKLQIVSGLDLLRGDQEALETDFKARVPDIENVSHVYFYAYVMDPDPKKEIQINVDLLRRAVTAVETLSSELKYVVLITGTKAYGVHLLEKFPFSDDLPLRESHPRIPEPYASEMFYYDQLDLIKSLSKGKSWTYCDLVPDVVVGFVPNNNIYSLAQWLSLYLSLYRDTNGEGAEVVFPGTSKSWIAKCNDSSQDLIARFAIHASLHPEISADERFNIADNAVASTWSAKWPIICTYFGLKGVPPTNGSGPDPAQYLGENADRWAELEEKYGLQKGRVSGNSRSFQGFPAFIMSMFDFDRPLDLSKTHQAWGSGKEERNTQEAWYTAFDRFRAAKIIP